ncbi:MAG TPA: hypothetical protein VL361_06520 [Candidatus Limnocylindrales bacterium]|nr:hypothetical protein [Candidatus Limnocylindrales bacterium]
MQIYKLAALAGAILTLFQSTRAATLTFVPTVDNSWFSSGNWFTIDAGGNLVQAGRLPLNTDTAVITGIVDAGASGLRVQTLLATNNAVITNGTFAIENLEMLSGSSFGDSIVNVLVTLWVGGTNCALHDATLNIFGIASGIFQPVLPATAATLNLAEGSVLHIGGGLTLTAGSQITVGGLPQSQLLIDTGGVLATTNATFVLGSPGNHLIVDNSGLIRVDGGTLQFDGGIDWHASGGTGEFRAAAANSFLFFATPFHVDLGVSDAFTGPGTNRWIAGASVDGAGQVSGNLEIVDSVSGAGTIEIMGTTFPGGTLNWSNGSLSLASVNIDSGGTMLFTGGAGTARRLSGCTLNNSGMCWVLSGDLLMDQGAVLFNMPGAIFEVRADGTFSGAPGPLGGAFHNAGTFRKTSSGTTFFGTAVPPQGPDFNNNGLVDIQSGQLNLLGGISSGEFRSAEGTTLWFWGTTHTLTAGASFTGAGTVRLLEGIAPAEWLMNGPITVTSLELGANGTIDAQGTTNWIYFGSLFADANGSLNNGNFAVQTFTMYGGAGLTNSTLNVSNSLTISGTNCSLKQSTLRLLPAVSANMQALAPATNATLSLSQGSLLEDNGIFKLGEGSVIAGSTAPPQSRLVVSPGALLLSATTNSINGSSTNHLIVDNSGTIRAVGATLQLGPGIDWKSSGGAGEFNTGPTNSFLIFTGPFQVESGVNSLFSGPGTTRWLNGATLSGEAQISGNVEILDTVTGAGTIHVLGGGLLPGVLNWLDGTLSLAGINVDPSGALLINPGPGSSSQISGSLINNAGSCRWLGQGTITGGAGATINNLPGGTLDVQTDVNLSNSAPPFVTINNGGLLLKSAGNGQSSLAADFLNSGNLEIKTGRLRFNGAWTQTEGIALIDAGTILGGTTLNVQGGTLSGPGTIDATLVNGGIVRPGGSPGTLTVTKDYQQTATGILNIELGGFSPGVQSDQLVVRGAANLGGRLQLNVINGYNPQPAVIFQILSCAMQAGSFSQIDPSTVSDTIWMPRYNGTNVTVSLAETTLLSTPTVSQGVITVPFNTTVGFTYIVQATDSLTSPNWRTLATVPGNGSIRTVSDSASAARRFYRVLVQ